MMRRTIVPALLVLTAASPLPRPAALYRAVPFIGCRSDGQQGPQPAPDRATAPLPIWTPARAALAFYQGPDLGVLAPAGWQCLEMSGSNGETLVVQPRLTKGDAITGPAVQLSRSFGSTSGRFQVARVAARIFPVARRFTDDVEKEGLLDKPLVRHPYPTDRIVSRDDTHVRFVTPARHQGLGTLSRLAPGDRPIEGLEVLVLPMDDLSLIALTLRLPSGQAGLAGTIIAQAQDAAR
jgi:hypothetical protein